MTFPENLAENMKKFQAKNDLPIHLKGGPLDRGLFGLTCALCGVGLLGVVHLIYTMGFAKKTG